MNSLDIVNVSTNEDVEEGVVDFTIELKYEGNTNYFLSDAAELRRRIAEVVDDYNEFQQKKKR